MKRFFVILALLIIYLLFSAKSCNDREEYDAARDQKQLETSIDSISSAFSSDKLTPEALRAFEETAKQRFSDFLDYLTILSDTTTAPTFKDNARRMIRELFISDHCVLRFTSTTDAGTKEIPLSVLLDLQSDFIKNLRVSQPDSIRIINALQHVNDSLYAGKLGVLFKVSDLTVNGKRYYFAGRDIEFFAVKRPKSFGKEILKGWDILFGEY